MQFSAVFSYAGRKFSQVCILGVGVTPCSSKSLKGTLTVVGFCRENSFCAGLEKLQPLLRIWGTCSFSGAKIKRLFSEHKLRTIEHKYCSGRTILEYPTISEDQRNY